ncbi:hypothetical protein [Hymenobacter cavernae]|uniref:Uncharacterized protein n=1 Tax=Hymenobacter cavernae TaxID=2044852 RepID=A0ABQ1U9S4_9BACT|nr:hypothetical protein [Hymenobacter cavernae]GGF12628.1 hypothetical protein GCM10011383_24780 [Hymenobacter cavernae]
MKKLALFFAMMGGALLGNAVSASAQSFCTLGGAAQCSNLGATRGNEVGVSLCGNLDGRERSIRESWFLAEQAQSQGRWDDYAYWSAYSDGVAGALCPLYGRQSSPTSATPADNTKAKETASAK